MTGPEIFRAELPALIAAARTSDPNLSVVARRAMRGLANYDLPIGIKAGDVLVGVLPKKLEGVNRWMNDWRTRSFARKNWGKHLKDAIAKGERAASFDAVKALGRAPQCQVRMTVQVLRFVPSVRQFLRDDDSLSGCPKQLYDALKDVGLIRDDRREWLQMLPVTQDVSPIPLTPVTMFFLWPATDAGQFTGVPNVHRASRQPARRKGESENGGTGEGRSLPSVRRRVGARAVDV